MTQRTEVWLRGGLPDFDPFVVPIAHSLLQAREDIEQLVGTLSPEQVWVMPGGAASVGFHVRHLGGALDRLFTYARGEQLNESQKAALRSESTSGASLDELVRDTSRLIERALDQLRSTSRDDLLRARTVGRAALPTTVLGLFAHAAEHCTRHAGQAITTAKIVTSSASAL